MGNKFKLIIVADDFGATEGINNAIIKLHEKGIINFTAIIANGEGFNDAINKIKNYPDLNIGLHFILSDWNSFTDGKTISENGIFFPREKLLLKAIQGKIMYEDVYNELKIQYEILLENKIKVKFLNSHRHIHIFPVISDTVIDFAREKNLLVRVPDEKIFLSFNLKQLIKKKILNYFAKKFRKKIGNLKFNDYFISNWCLETPEFTIDETLKLLKKFNQSEYKGKVIEYMVHPAFYTESLLKVWLGNEKMAKQREKEFQMLNSDSFYKFYNSIK